MAKYRARDGTNVDTAKGEQTKAQLVGTTVSFGAGRVGLTSPLPKTYKTYRELRKDPTIALARAVSVAPIMASSWDLEGEDEERVEFIRKQLLPQRDLIVEPALYGGIDFGWQGFELVYGDEGGRTTLRKVKPLLHDITEVMVHGETGAFAGYRQGSVDVPVEACLHVAFRVEGTQWYGQSLLENARAACEQWREANAGAARFDKKIAGAHWVVGFPQGQSKVNGVMKPNDQIAQEVLRALESSGCVAVPRAVAKFVEQLDKEEMGWKIELLTAPGTGSFTDRLRYLDVLKVRSILVPERMALEAEFGTKADAGVHSNLAVTMRELEHQHLTRLVCWHVVDRLLALNWGEEARGSVVLKATPLTDDALAFLRSLYTALMANPQGFAAEYPNIGMEALRDRLRVPKEANPQPLPPAAGPGGPEPPEGLTREEVEKVKASFSASHDVSDQPRGPRARATRGEDIVHGAE